MRMSFIQTRSSILILAASITAMTCSFYRGETVQKVFNRLASLEVVDEVLKRHSGTDKDGCSAHDFEIGVDDSL
jgi:ABC-type uncharacterized transport system permease subunit